MREHLVVWCSPFLIIGCNVLSWFLRWRIPRSTRTRLAWQAYRSRYGAEVEI